MKGYLILANGQVFTGQSWGAIRDTTCELVFHTAMMGYVEVLTDPGHLGQGVVMSYPLIGNYGTCAEDFESRRPWLSAMIVREVAPLASNFRNQCGLEEVMLAHQISGLCGVDTRALVQVLRDQGEMTALLTFDAKNVTGEGLAYSVTHLSAYKPQNVASVSGTPTVYNENGAKTVAVVDLGIRNSVIRALTDRNLRVQTFTHDATVEEILACNPDGILFSNGPGSPTDCLAAVQTAKTLIDSGRVVLGIDLGHLVMAKACGADIVRVKHGHRGNVPVRDMATGRIYTTRQNHGYVLNKVPERGVMSYQNGNDHTIAGVSYGNAFSVQFFPGGAMETADIYDTFAKKMEVSYAEK